MMQVGIQEDLEQCDDETLIGLVRPGNEECIKVLVRRYRRFVRAQVRPYSLPGSDREDLLQEGMIGLYKAIRDFDPAQETPFRAFAAMCISRHVLTAIRNANREKCRPLNDCISLDVPVFQDDKEGQLEIDRLRAPSSSDPADLVVSAEVIEEIGDTIRSGLTDLESDVFGLYVAGRSYAEIADLLGSRIKSIDNALQRIKKKVQRHL